MQLILYTAPDIVENEIAIIRELLELGVDYLYIRKPELDDFSLVDFIEKIPEKYWKKCISSSLIITKEFNLGGYHFTRDILQKNEKYNSKVLDWLHTNNKISSVSAHSLNDIKNYATTFKHIIISPIFPSISKENHYYDWDFDTIKKEISNLKSQISNLKLFAVGGIEKNKINFVKQLGFNGVGVLGTIWNSPNLEIDNLKQTIETIKNTAEYE